MGVDEQQPLVLARERAQDFEQQHVLVDVGEVAGVILVTILHETRMFRAARLYTVVRGENYVEDIRCGDSVGRGCRAAW